MTRWLILFLLLPGIPGLAETTALAQAPVDSAQFEPNAVEESLQRLLDERPEGKTPEQLVEQLSHFSSNPLDVNTASAATLGTLPALSLAAAHRIVRHRIEHGPFASVEALARIDGLTPRLLQALRPYLTASDTEATGSASPYPSVPSFKTITSNLNADLHQRVDRTLDLAQGFTEDSSRSAFQGSPLRLTSRLRLHHKRRIQAAVTTDKDPGEPIRWSPPTNTYGFDHVAGHLALQDMGRLKTLVVGDYTAEFGQGLALWQGLTFGKGRNPVSSVVREGRGFVPFASTSEDSYFRGVATTMSVTPTFTLSGFVSRRRRDASLDSSAVGDLGGRTVPARTLSTGGLHRTANERARKASFGTQTIGGAATLRTRQLVIGLTGYQSRFDRPLTPPDQPFRRFDVAGTSSSMASLYATGFFDDYVLFGEAARAGNGAIGFLAGAALHHDAGIDGILLGRRYPPAFNGLFGGAFSDGSSPQNEMGIYTGLRLQIADRWHIGGYVDQYRFPWLRFGVPRPTSGLDARLVVEAEPRPWLSSYVQLRTQREATGADFLRPNGGLVDGVQDEHRQSIRWHTEYDFSDRLTLRTRIEASRYQADGVSPSTGFFLYQGLGLDPHRSLDIDARFALFDTDGFESRIYAYEHDLLYSFSVPAFFGQGQRSYVVTRYSPTSFLTLEAKYGITWYPHRESVGSGLNTRETNRVRRASLQLRWRL